MLRYLLVVLVLMLPVSHSRADTPLDILGVEKTVNDAGRKAQETGDRIAQAFAEQALRVLAEWKRTHSDLINQAFDRWDDSSKRLITDINNVATRIEKGEAVAFVDIQRTMATAGDILGKRIPGSSDEPLVSFYWPAVTVPVGTSTITMRVIGSLIAESNPKITLAGKSIPLRKVSDNEVRFDVDRKSLLVDENDPKMTTFLLTYEVSTSHWYNPLSWWSKEVRERSLDLRVLPKIPGYATVVPSVRETVWETRVDGPHIVGGRGKDNTYSAGYSVPPALREDGWILDKAAQGGARSDDNGGDGNGGSSCVGYDQNSFADYSLSYTIQHGHVTSGFSKNDAYQNCRIWVHLKRKKEEVKSGDAQTKKLNWVEDVDFDLPANTAQTTIEVKLYDGLKLGIRRDRQIPYGLFEIFQEKDSIKFRPRPIREF